MRCPKCKEQNTLVASVNMSLELPLLKGGGVNGKALAEAWRSLDPKEKRISCSHCGTPFTYVNGTGLQQVPTEALEELEPK